MTRDDYWKLRCRGEQLQRAREQREAVIVQATRLLENATLEFERVALALGLDPKQNVKFDDERCEAVNIPVPPEPMPSPQAATVRQIGRRIRNSRRN